MLKTSKRLNAHARSPSRRVSRESLHRVLRCLDQAVVLARIAVDHDADRAAWHVTDTLRELGTDLRVLRRVARA